MNKNLKIGLLGIDFKNTAPDLRTQFHLSRQQVETIYREHWLPDETVILSTCNRVEFYFLSVGDRATDEQRLQTVYGENSRAGQAFHYQTGATAVGHLLELAVGLRSLLVGETEILGQIATAQQLAGQLNGSNEILNQLFTKAIAAARRIRRQTNIGGFSSSWATLAVRELKRLGNDLRRRSALILGNGEIAQKIAQAFCYQGITTTLLVRGPNSKQGVKPCKVVAGAAICFGYEHLEELLASHDIVVAATAAPHLVLKMEHRSLLRDKVVIDLAFPRNVDPGVAAQGNCCLWDLEYFGQLAAENQHEKDKAVQVAKDLCRQTEGRISAALGVRLTLILKEYHETTDNHRHPRQQTGAVANGKS